MNVQSLFLFLSSQGSGTSDVVTQNVDHPDWQYWVAISVLSTTVATLFGIILKGSSNRAEEIKQLNKEHNEALDTKAKRVADEFERKDKAILEVSTEFAKLMERVAHELRGLNEKG